MLRIHLFQQWFSLSGQAMQDALFEVPMYREFVGNSGAKRAPDRVSVLRLRPMLEEH
jgi:transposase, IS5 family